MDFLTETNTTRHGAIMLTANRCINTIGKVTELDLVLSNPFNACVTIFQSLE